MNTKVLSKEDGFKERRWVVIDAQGQVLGRLASQVAAILRGKNKPTFSPHLDVGDFVVVINADGIKLTGNKLESKIYYHHTGYIGGVKSETAGERLNRSPEMLISEAVKGMLPRGPLGFSLLRKLKVYRDGQHPHTAQQPTVANASGVMTASN